MSEIKAGDVVMLKCGGEDMVVESVESRGGDTPSTACFMWFAGDGNRIMRDSAPVVALNLVKSAD